MAAAVAEAVAEAVATATATATATTTTTVVPASAGASGTASPCAVAAADSPANATALVMGELAHIYRSTPEGMPPWGWWSMFGLVAVCASASVCFFMRTSRGPATRGYALGPYDSDEELGASPGNSQGLLLQVDPEERGMKSAAKEGAGLKLLPPPVLLRRLHDASWLYKPLSAEEPPDFGGFAPPPALSLQQSPAVAPWLEPAPVQAAAPPPPPPMAAAWPTAAPAAAMPTVAPPPRPAAPVPAEPVASR